MRNLSSYVVNLMTAQMVLPQLNEPRCSKGEMLISLLYQVDHGRMILELLQIRPMPVLNLNTKIKRKVRGKCIE
uniref:Uncharacterized protein n=1 Tax=Daphnia galeata TaxID=27404 RepID=A0A8J2S9J9_9CRUS|nr:unnamed protein product [Daphnia galeata]